MRVLITGGAGFIGSNLCERLSADPDIDEIRVLDDGTGGDPERLVHLPVAMISGSVCDPDVVRVAADGVDAIVHLAAHHGHGVGLGDPTTTVNVAVSGMLNVLEAARSAGDAHVVMTSSAAVYGANPALPSHEDLTPIPRTPFAASKLAAEALCASYQMSFGVPSLVLRLFDVYGPHQRTDAGEGAVVASFVNAALDGEPLRIFGDGRQTRDFIDVDTVCRVISSSLADRVAHPRPMNIASGRRTSVLELAQIVAAKVGGPISLRNESQRSGDDRNRCADVTRMHTRFATLAPTPLDDGITEMVAWARSERGSALLSTR